jgi:hypothetical protein
MVIEVGHVEAIFRYPVTWAFLCFDTVVAASAASVCRHGATVEMMHLNHGLVDELSIVLITAVTRSRDAPSRGTLTAKR